MENWIWLIGWGLVSLIAYLVLRLGWWKPGPDVVGPDEPDWATAVALGAMWPILPAIPIYVFLERRRRRQRHQLGRKPR